jgi:glucosamine-6-phosphate deaminase
MDIHIHDDPASLGRAAGREAAAALRDAVAARGSATYVVATGASQFETLATLTGEDVPWEKITIFHLDEYAGLSDSHPASFRRYLRERLLERLPRPPAAFHGIDASRDAAAECRRLAALVPAGAFDVATIGIGENGHLAFNDPPADFDTLAPYHRRPPRRGLPPAAGGGGMVCGARRRADRSDLDGGAADPRHRFGRLFGARQPQGSRRP